MTAAPLSAAKVGGARGWVLGGAGLMVGSLGLPWTSDVPGTYLPGYLSPSYCTPDYYSGITSCTYGSYTPGIFLPGSGGAPGYATAARVFVAAAMGLLWLAGRATSTSVRRHRLLAAAVVAAAGAAVAGSAARSGAVVMLLSVGCLAVALRRDASASDP